MKETETSVQLATPEKRILEFFEFLKESNQVRFYEEIYDKTGIIRQYVQGVKKGDKRFTSSQIKSICETYLINANWIFGVEDNMFRIKNPYSKS